MNKPLLSILIPTVVGRETQLKILADNVCKQAYNRYHTMGDMFERYWDLLSPVEIIIKKDNKEMTIGEKREYLYRVAVGKYVLQIDDDDNISPDAIQLILEAIKQEPDCITFQEHCMINGVHFKSNHSLSYGDWEGDGQREFSDGFHYHRTPFMKSVIKTEIARTVPIPHIRFGEDHQWAQALKPHLKTEVHIDKDIYFYQHISSPHNERYGIR